MANDTGRDQNGHIRVEAAESAETKRLAARRRFLLGGAAAVPVIVTLGQKQAWAASAAVCQSAGLAQGQGFIGGDEVTTSLYCRP